jgi:hypothetical protein
MVKRSEELLPVKNVDGRKVMFRYLRFDGEEENLIRYLENIGAKASAEYVKKGMCAMCGIEKIHEHGLCKKHLESK